MISPPKGRLGPLALTTDQAPLMCHPVQELCLSPFEGENESLCPGFPGAWHCVAFSGPSFMTLMRAV